MHWPGRSLTDVNFALDHRPLHQERQRHNSKGDQGEDPEAVEECLCVGLLIAHQADGTQAHQLTKSRVASHLGEEPAGRFQGMAVAVLSGCRLSVSRNEWSWRRR